jgi:hypothetical protein
MFIWTLPQSPRGGIYLSFAAGIPYTTETAIQTTQNFIVLVLALIPKPAPQCLRASENWNSERKSAGSIYRLTVET